MTKVIEVMNEDEEFSKSQNSVFIENKAHFNQNV